MLFHNLNGGVVEPFKVEAPIVKQLPKDKAARTFLEMVRNSSKVVQGAQLFLFALNNINTENDALMF